MLHWVNVVRYRDHYSFFERALCSIESVWFNSKNQTIVENLVTWTKSEFWRNPRMYRCRKFKQYFSYQCFHFFLFSYLFFRLLVCFLFIFFFLSTHLIFFSSFFSSTINILTNTFPNSSLVWRTEPGELSCILYSFARQLMSAVNAVSTLPLWLAWLMTWRAKEWIKKKKKKGNRATKASFATIEILC